MGVDGLDKFTHQHFLMDAYNGGGILDQYLSRWGKCFKSNLGPYRTVMIVTISAKMESILSVNDVR